MGGKELVITDNKSIIVSPLSIQIVLALTTEGANCLTSQELTRGLRLPNSKSVTKTAVKSLLTSFNKTSDNLKLLLANKMYVDQTFQVKSSFISVATRFYGAGVQNVNFGDNVVTADLINQWVEDQTNNRIQNLIKPDQLNSDVRIVLVNTLYFIGNWTIPFPDYRTTKRIFYSSSHSSKEIDFMHSADFATYKYFHCGYLKAKFLEIPYKGGNISMIIILPDAIDGISYVDTHLEDYLKADKFTVQRVAVRLPKFSITTEFDVKPLLQNVSSTL
ncbi:hypothetical protein NQ314_005943 [Rhamnusium bicolor]|uniref:Serpin domain-containing protein n=1 Tax=Rhamnusium bicolor TaxID=1586634 RepID=A0AAV8ZAV5_9CUCU|nr:hypothetical protein NQ314_005943 [Rhamnusium bicolor]